MKTKLLGIWFLFMLTAMVSKAQDNLPQVLNSTGNYVVINGYQFDYSVGEMTAIETFTFSENMLTQGFLQSILIPDIISEFGSEVIVYPDMSPNNDGQGNETLFIQNITNYPNNELQIFNRWGNLIFKIKGYDNGERIFTGKANTGLLIDGAEVPDGTYFYVLRFSDDITGQIAVKNGFFVIKRK